MSFENGDEDEVIWQNGSITFGSLDIFYFQLLSNKIWHFCFKWTSILWIFCPEWKQSFQLTVSCVEKQIQHELGSGRKVSCFLLCNPSNPLGVVYPGQLVMDLMKLCHKYKIHFVCDEIYALSVYGNARFTSVLSFSREQAREELNIW